MGEEGREGGREIGTCEKKGGGQEGGNEDERE